MAEPPAKRAKRTDSSAMWERNSPRPTDAGHLPRSANGASGMREKRDDRERNHGRDDRRYRSRSKERRRDRTRSRDRPEKPRRERSHSRERGGRRHKNGERDGARDRRDKERSRSREKHRSRRGSCTEPDFNLLEPRLTSAADEAPSRRSRSPRKDHTSTRTRTRTPPRPSKPPRSRSPPSKPSADRAPPTGPRTSTRTAPSKPPLPTTDSTPKLATKTNGVASSSEPSKTQDKDAMEVDEDSDPEIAEMRKAMGFTGFKSTKNTKVKGNDVSGVRKEKKTEYRQYMNRVGGFNRPLSPSR